MPEPMGSTEASLIYFTLVVEFRSELRTPIAINKMMMRTATTPITVHAVGLR